MQREAATGRRVVFPLCLYCGGIYAMLRKSMDRLKVK